MVQECGCIAVYIVADAQYIVECICQKKKWSSGLQNRIEAAKKRKQQRQAQLLAENKDNNIDTTNMRSGQSQFITDYQTETRRWTTNTATTRFSLLKIQI